METKDLQSQLARTEDWVKNADTKIGVLLAFEGVFLLLLFRRFAAVVFDVTTPTYLVVGYITVLVVVSWSILKALTGIIPRLKHGQGKGSLLYFYDVKATKLKDFKKRIKGLKQTQYEDELIGQIHAISVVVTRKMACFKDAVTLLIIGLTLMGIIELCQRLMNLAAK